jgi:hypothetical protein
MKNNNWNSQEIYEFEVSDVYLRDITILKLIKSNELLRVDLKNASKVLKDTLYRNIEVELLLELGNARADLYMSKLLRAKNKPFEINYSTCETDELQLLPESTETSDDLYMSNIIIIERTIPKADYSLQYFPENRVNHRITITSKELYQCRAKANNMRLETV